MVSVQSEAPGQADIVALIALSDKLAAELYPGAFRRVLSGKVLEDLDCTVLVARTAMREAAGCCLLFLAGDGTGEVKRMVVHPRHRRQGVGRALMQAAIEAARSGGANRLQLEVGVRNREAKLLYADMGFQACGPFGNYKHSPIATFMARDLYPVSDDQT